MTGRSARLAYAPLTATDAAGLFPALGDPRVSEFLGPAPTVGDLAAQFASAAAGPPADRPGEVWHNLAVRLLTGGESIGRVEATVQGTHAEVAYLLGPAHWGHGYAGEALGWLGIGLAGRGVTTLWATVHPANARSRRVLTRAGYAETGLPDAPRLLSHDPGDVVYTKPAFPLALPDEAATAAFGHALATTLGPGSVVALVGPLGAGKTTLTRAICAGLGVPNLAAVTSPTFGLVHEYRGRLPVFHFDTYRLKSPREFAELGVEEYYAAGGVCLVEWADRVTEYLPADRLTVTLAHSAGGGRVATADMPGG